MTTTMSNDSSTSNDSNAQGLRSRGTADPKTSPQAVLFSTALSGPPGAPLRRKYLEGAPTTKGTRLKSSGNNGTVGRAYRSKLRMHGGGQVTPEEKERRAAQSAAAVRERSESPLWPR